MLGRGTYNLLYVQRYSILRAFTFTVALLTFITGKVRPFQVTSKSAGKSADSASWRMIMPHMILIGISLLGLITLVLNFSGMIWYQADPGPMVIAGVWVAINIALLISSAARVFASSFRQQYRFPLKVKLEWRFKGAEAWQPGQTSDMSSGGLSFEYSGFNLRSGDYVEVNISNADNLNNLKASSIEKKGIKLLGRVVNLHNNQGDLRVSGLVIDKFADEASLYNYTLLVHSPAVLLHGEKVFNTEVPDARNLAPVVDGWLATSHNQMKHPGLFLKGSEE
jgi:hypothetical protein